VSSSSRDGTASAIPDYRLGRIYLASYLYAISYGATFLLSLLIASRGGNDADAGTVISAATVSSIVAIVLSGHVIDRIGAARSVAAAGALLCLACIGFAATADIGVVMLASALMFGIGWGIFYTLVPLIVAMTVEPAHRIRYFTLLTGSTMSGIGSGPLIGRACIGFGLPIESAFYIAAATVGFGTLLLLSWDAQAHSRRLAAGGSVPVCKISVNATLRVLRSRAAFSIAMVGLGACIFGGLSSFQTSYAAQRQLDYSLFFVGFMSAAILSRLSMAGVVGKRDPLVSASVLTGMIALSILLFLTVVDSPATYLLAAAVLGGGYGLTYPIINVLAANEAPPQDAPQSLLLFSLSYFIGIFGFPMIAGRTIVTLGIGTMLLATLAIAVANWAIAVGRLIDRKRRKVAAMAQV